MVLQMGYLRNYNLILAITNVFILGPQKKTTHCHWTLTNKITFVLNLFLRLWIRVIYNACIGIETKTYSKLLILQ